MADLSLTGKRWKPVSYGSAEDVATLASRLKQERGLADDGDAFADPRRFAGMLIAADLVRRTLATKTTIGIVADYDCDGITGAAQMIRLLRRHGQEPFVRLPHRLHEGYGLHQHIVDECAAAGVQLLITIDLGITAATAIEHATSLGMRTIVIDHHHLPSALPAADAIVHPELSTLALPHPCASGIVLNVLHALEGNTWEDQDTDSILACFGTVADLVPLRGMNRGIVQEGLRALARTRNPPILAFLENAGVSPAHATSQDIAFRLAPRINAAGRMEEPMTALHALLGDREALLQLERHNAERQQMVRGHEETLADILTSDAAFLTACSGDFSPGILGLLAGKMTERSGRPSMVGCTQGATCIASLRSPLSYNIIEALERHRHLLVSFGGHAQAAGIVCEQRLFKHLCAALEADAEVRLPREDRVPVIEVDAKLSPTMLGMTLLHAVTDLEPFGQGNREPRFLLENVLLDAARCVGSDSRHLQASVCGRKMIGFGLGSFLAQTAEPLDLVCRIGMNRWNGMETLQLMVDDLRPAHDRGRSSSASEQNSLTRARTGNSMQVHGPR